MIVSSTGENNPAAKLSEKNVLDILDLSFNQKIKVKEIFNIYFGKITKDSIYNILKGKTWIDIYNKFITESLESGGKINDT